MLGVLRFAVTDAQSTLDQQTQSGSSINHETTTTPRSRDVNGRIVGVGATSGVDGASAAPGLSSADTIACKYALHTLLWLANARTNQVKVWGPGQ